MKKTELLVQRRLFERISSDIEARFFFGNIFYSGIVKNMSENGMFIQTLKCFPLKAIFPVIIHTNNAIVNLLVRVRWAAPGKNLGCGMGLEIINPNGKYFHLISSIRSSFNHTGNSIPGHNA